MISAIGAEENGRARKRFWRILHSRQPECLVLPADLPREPTPQPAPPLRSQTLNFAGSFAQIWGCTTGWRFDGARGVNSQALQPIRWIAMTGKVPGLNKEQHFNRNAGAVHLECKLKGQ